MRLLNILITNSFRIAVISGFTALAWLTLGYAIVFFNWNNAMGKVLYLLMPLFLGLSVIAFTLAAATIIIKTVRMNYFKTPPNE